MAQSKKVSIGIDIGGTNTVFGFVDPEGNCLLDGHIATTDYAKFDDFLKALSSEIENVKKSIPQAIEIVGIGIGAPNGNYYAGTIEHAPNLQWKGVVPFIESFKKYYDVPMILTNDANAAAIGEMVYGAAKGMKNFVVITLGTGLGSGIVVNGDLVYGVDGFAGEIGHTFAGEAGGRKCGCGRYDCLETYASATGIKRTAFELMCSMNEPSKLRDHSFNQVTSKMIYDAAKDGDPIALAVFEKTGRILGARLADAVAYLSPEAIFLFGGLAKSAEFLFKPTMSHIEKNMLNIFKYSNKFKLLPSGLEESSVNGAILGASALVWKEIGKN